MVTMEFPPLLNCFDSIGRQVINKYETRMISSGHEAALFSLSLFIHTHVSTAVVSKMWSLDGTSASDHLGAY
jgi:hypothetical protein